MSARDVIAAVLASAVILASCADDEGPATSGQTAETTGTSATPAAQHPTGNTHDASSEPRTASIEMKDAAFKPAYVTARVGQTLVFRKQDDVAHKIKADEGQYLTSKTLNKGQTYRYGSRRTQICPI